MKRISMRYKQVAVIGVIAAALFVVFALVTFYLNQNEVFEIFSVIAAIVSIEVGVVALAYSWYVNKESSAQLNEILSANEEAKRINEEAKRINETNRDSIGQIAEQAVKWESQFEKMYNKQIEILTVITNRSLRQLNNSLSETERIDFERELQQHKTALAQLNEEGNDLHQLFLKSLH